jgi:hypothetical protein
VCNRQEDTQPSAAWRRLLGGGPLPSCRLLTVAVKAQRVVATQHGPALHKVAVENNESWGAVAESAAQLIAAATAHAQCCVRGGGAATRAVGVESASAACKAP